MLDPLLPRANAPPWNAWDDAPSVHAALLVHRVRGLEPGLYTLLRDDSALGAIRSALRLVLRVPVAAACSACSPACFAPWIEELCTVLGFLRRTQDTED